MSVELGLKGKPAPDVFTEATWQLGVLPQEATVIEDALTYVKAGKAGGFAPVVIINWTDQATEFLKYGADLVLDKFPTE